MGEVSSQEFRPKSLDFFEKFRFTYKKPTVEGKENLPQTPCVIATTHLSGFDVPEVYSEVTKGRKTGVSLQASFLNHPLFKPIASMIGKENLFPLSNRNSAVLRDDELDKIKDVIVSQGRTLVVAAHSPTNNWELPDKPGLAAVILAHQTSVPLVPTVLDIKSEIPVRERIIAQVKHVVSRNRPDSKIVFGNSMLFPEISEDKLQLAISLYSPDKRRAMTKTQVEEAKKTLDIIKPEAEEVMKALASNLPEEKRGKWG